MLKHFDDFADKGNYSGASVAIVHNKPVVLERILDYVSRQQTFTGHKHHLNKLERELHRTKYLEIFAKCGSFEDTAIQEDTI